MNKNHKIGIAILISFIVVFGLLYFLNSSASVNDSLNFSMKKFDCLELKFYSIHNSTNSIFLIGSSHVGVLNTTQINQIVGDQSNSTVYNLARIGDTPERRIFLIDDLVSEKPILIFYGLNLRDFESDGIEFTVLEKLASSIDPKSFSELKRINPKFLTINMLNTLLKDKSYDVRSFTITDSYTPAIKFSKENTEIATYDILKNLLSVDSTEVKHIPEYSQNIQVTFLEKILLKFKENNIKIILFITPVSELYLDSIPFKKLEQFNSIVEKISDKYDIKVYDLS